jgi:hypothetical protein
MTDSHITPISRRQFDAQQLMQNFPPRFRHRNKQIVFSLAFPPGSTANGTIEFTRWDAMLLPLTISWNGEQPTFEPREDLFDYAPPRDPSTIEWHLNFANEDLFTAYSGSLFAQDEMQVTEHPALGSLREALLTERFVPLTVGGGRPTPALIKGVERRVSIATEPNAAEGRPYGLYGNNFASAKEDALRAASRVIDPPTVSNILAMEAPSYGSGRYTLDQIHFIVTTAYTGFSAARLESAPDRCLIHTGFWGCGAYGGHRVLMALLQMVAACLSRIDVLVFHTHQQAGSKAFAAARDIFEREVGDQEKGVNALLDRIEAMGFEWGVSDGT